MKRKIEAKYPYMDLSLNNLRNEHWEDIPGLDGCYCVSNYGRIMRQSFEILCSNGKLMQIRPMILKTDIVVKKNMTVEDEIFFLRIKIMRSGAIYDFSIPRLVYYCFVTEFDLSDYSLVVLCKDGNGKNVNPKNLALVDLHSKQRRIYDRNRFKKIIVYSYDEFIQQGLEKSTTTYCKQVSQYSFEGRRIQTYPSSSAASQALMISASGITSVLKGRQVSCGGFVWRYGKKGRTNMKKLREERSMHRKKLIGQKLTQYSAKGKRVATYLTIADAARETGISSGDLSETLKGKQRSAGGYVWKKGWGNPTIDIRGYQFGEKWRALRREKPVKQYCHKGKYIRTFPSVKEAAKQMGITASAISTAINREGSLSKGFIWKVSGKKV
jgi:hypothetical protein